MTYSIAGYAGMIADHPRTEAYSHALRQAIKPGAAVLDLGTGTGYFALLACQLGARRVYAIEPGDAIALARRVAADNGYSDRIVFFQEMSTAVELPERVDVIVSDLHGVLPWFDRHIPSIVDARERFLASHGVLIPRRDTVWAAVVETPDLYRRHTAPWEAINRDLAVDIGAMRELLANTWRRASIDRRQLITGAIQWATLDYERIVAEEARGVVETKISRAGIGHGLALWFDTELAQGIGFSNAPGEPETIYGCGFFPWTRPVSVEEGDDVTAEIKADRTGDDYVWRWNTKIRRSGEAERVVDSFHQSTFLGTPLSTETLKKREAGHVPHLTGDGEIDRFILTLMDESRSVGEIAERLAERFSERFSNRVEALNRVADLSRHYSR
ncbi:hypothetical protein BH18GEM1_BH18GEM1_07000 [soil metagenome]